MLWIPAYFLARAACSVAAERGEDLSARAWLIYPPMVLLASSLAAALLAGPFLPLAIAAIDQGWAEGLLGGVRGVVQTTMQILARASLIGLALGLWWMVLAPISRWTIRPLRALLAPLADHYDRRHAFWLGLLGLVLTAASASVLLWTSQ